MAVSGADSSRVNRVLTTTLDRYSPEISNEIKRNDGIVAVFGANGSIKMADGGTRAIETVDRAENDNINWRANDDVIDTRKQDTRLQAKYAWATLDGAVVINDIEKAMNAGDQVLYKLVEAEVTNAKNTIVRKIADALRASSPATTEPESLVTMVPATAFGSQTTSTGELSRTTYAAWWQSQYSHTSMDLSGAAGLESLIGFYLQSASKGTSRIDQPNFGLTTGTLFAALIATWGDAIRRYGPEADSMKLGFQTIKVMNMDVIADPSITSGYFYMINTNHMFIQCLRIGNMQNIGERPQSIPVSVRPFQEAYNQVESASLLHITMALTASSLQRQGLADNCS